jgi:hypothetical protein
LRQGAAWGSGERAGRASGGLVVAVGVEHELTEGLAGGDVDYRCSGQSDHGQPNAEIFIFRVKSTYAGLPCIPALVGARRVVCISF